MLVFSVGRRSPLSPGGSSPFELVEGRGDELVHSLGEFSHPPPIPPQPPPFVLFTRGLPPQAGILKMS